MKKLFLSFILTISAPIHAQVLSSQPNITNIDNHLYVNPQGPSPDGVFALGYNVNVSSVSPVYYNMGDFTKFTPNNKPGSQRSHDNTWYGGTGFQAEGNTVGIIINSGSLAGTISSNIQSTNYPLVAMYNFGIKARPFQNSNKMLTYSVEVQVPQSDAVGCAVVNGVNDCTTNYASMVFLLRDTSTNRHLWYAASFFDHRGNSMKKEFLHFDAWASEGTSGALNIPIVSGIVSKPGQIYHTYTTPLDSSQNFTGTPWNGFRRMKYGISRANFQYAINKLKNSCTNCVQNLYSGDPSDYELVHYNFNPEVHFVNTPGSHGMMALSFRNLTVSLENTVGSPIYRFFNSSTNKHFYTASADEAKGLGSAMVLENIAGRVYRNTSERTGLIPVYRMFKAATQDHFYTISSTERTARLGQGYIDEGILGYALNQSSCSEQQMYRVYRASLQRYFYTSSLGEAQSAASMFGTSIENAFCMGNPG